MTPTDRPPVTVLRDSRRDPIEDEAACAEAVYAARWCDVIDKPAKFPVSTEVAEALLRRGGCFDVPDGELGRLVKCGQLPPPAQDEDGPEWSAADVIECARVLERRRQWRMDSPQSAKMLDQEQVLYAARQTGEVREIAAVLAGTGDPLGELLAMVHSESREMRLLHAVRLRFLLEGLGVTV